MSLIKKKIIFLFFLVISFFVFRNDILADFCIDIPMSCPTGYSKYFYTPDCPSMAECVFTGCVGLNGINYNAGTNNITSAACFETGESYCYAWTTWADSSAATPGTLFDPLPNESISACHWHTNSYCECSSSGNWIKHGSGCVGNLYCNNSNGWYSTCTQAWGGVSGNDCWYSYSQCKPCGNTPQQCYKKMESLSIQCEFDSQCGDDECCKNPGTTSSYCSTDCGTSTCYTPSGSTCALVGGTCSTVSLPNTTTQSGYCPGTPSNCLCRIPNPPTCQASSAANLATCTAFGGVCSNPANYANPVYLTGLCTGLSDCRCTKECPPNCSASANYCPSQTFADGCGGTCTGTKAVVANDIGTCGTADTSGATYSSPPSGSVLCADDDTPSIVSTNTSTYTWTCTGVAGSCVATQNLVTNCSATRDNPPTTPTVNIRTTDSTTNIPADLNPSTGLTNSNHICQSNFTSSSNPTTARFVVTYTDPQGGGDIASITLRIGSYSTTDSTLTVSGNTATAVFDISTASVPSLLNSLSLIQTSASDDHTYTGSVTPIVSSNRYFKFWDCNVSSSGTGYDGSLSGATCSAASFDPANAISFPYSLTMVGTGTPSVAMTVNSPNYSGNLVWGKSYVFNSDVPATNFKLRFNNDDSVCTSTIQFTIDKTKSNPYVNPALLDIDFTSILDQDPWWQARGGGAISNNILNNQVPVTCTDTSCKISINGLASSPTIYNTGKLLSESQNWYYSNTDFAKLANVNENYNHFKTEYYTKNEIGSLNLGTKTVTKTDDFGSDPNNIYFIEGDLNINGNIALGTRNFLMIIVSGNVTISNTVTQVDGILVANRITAAGENATALTFNGSIYASDYIDFTRGFTSGAANNTAPAVIINHNPSLLFNIPGKIAKILTSWQWGNN